MTTQAKDGLERFIAAAPNQSALGGAEGRCGRAAAATERVRSLSAAGDAESLTFGYELARQLPGFQAAEWTARLTAVGRRGGAGRSAVISGMMELDLGRTDEGRALIESGLLLPDRNLAHHLGREALRGIGKR